MLKRCALCKKRLRSDYQREECKECRSRCQCGAPKDWRADHCRSCASRKQTASQWKRPEVKAKMLNGIRARVRPRRQYEEIEARHFRARKWDGRYIAHCFVNDKPTIVYRSHWVWIQANGPIPEGHEIHHRNDDCSDDRLENLQCLTISEHQALHMDEDQKRRLLKGNGRERTGKTAFVCAVCGNSFEAYHHAGKTPRRYCSLPCRNEGYRIVH